MDVFLSLAKEAEFPYISCNFNKEGELVFAPYVIKEAAGLKIGFVGVTTPHTLSTSVPTYFQNGQGEFIYGFLQDDDGSSLYNGVQEAVDSARADGADLVYVPGHLGNDKSYEPWNYADVISHTTGIDVFFDGHSHDTDQVVMKDKEGKVEWGSRSVPDENGGFLNVSGLTYEIGTNIASGCIEDENAMFVGIEGERRVKNVKVGDEPLDPKKTYTLTGHNYMLQQQGDGFTMFEGVKFTQDCFKLDNQGLIDYIKGTLGGTVGEEYTDPYGQGRIVIK